MTQYLIGHSPYASARLSDGHGLIGDYTRVLDQTTERKIANLVRVDEVVAFEHARLCCDVGVFIRKPDGAAEDLLMVELSGQRLRDRPSAYEVALAQMLAQKHVLHLCDRIGHALVWMPTMVIDLRSFPDNDERDRQSDICIGYNTDVASPLVAQTRELMEQRGLQVALNDPLRGSLLPAMYRVHPEVTGLTLGIHQRLCDVGPTLEVANPARRVHLRSVLIELYELWTEFGCR